MLSSRGEHIHHGYFLDPADTKEVAQIRLMDLLLERSQLSPRSQVLDVGCGIGGTSRYLAKKMDCNVTGITISGQQVKLAKDLTAKETSSVTQTVENPDVTRLGNGSVRFLELDAEKIGDFFNNQPDKATFDTVWISEAMSHLPEKGLFFRNVMMLLNAGGKLVVADWFKAEELTDVQMETDIKPIEGDKKPERRVSHYANQHEDGMLLPGLNTQSEYVNFASRAGLKVFSKPFDISKQVSKTWCVPTSPLSMVEAVLVQQVLMLLGIYHGRWSKILLYGPLLSLRVEMA